jgi:hypothetical protein
MTDGKQMFFLKKSELSVPIYTLKKNFNSVISICYLFGTFVAGLTGPINSPKFKGGER